MTYAVANLHGRLDKFKALLQTLRFSDQDILYVLGDTVDHGEESAELLVDMSMRSNVYPIAGEHDFKALRMLSEFEKTLKSGAAPDPEFAAELTEWAADGGQATLMGYRALSAEMREGVLDYLADFALFEEAEAGGKRYVLVHAGIAGFEPDTPLEDYEPEDFFHPVEPGDRFFEDATLVVGHVPTGGRIRKEEGVIYLDCGLFEGDTLGCLCLETGEETYV